MKQVHLQKLAGVAAIALSLSACGGGGGGAGIASTPTPPPLPPPPQGAAVVIFSNPAPTEFASVGASINGPGGNLDTYASAADRFGIVSAADSDQAHIRYTAGGYYEIKLPSAEWDRLVHYGGLVGPTSANNYFQPAGVQTNQAYLVTSNTRNDGYSYSEMGGWGSASASRWGAVAFGPPTPLAGVPTTGSATYQGKLIGSADVMSADFLYGGYVARAVEGTVSLNFNFAQSTLAGSMTLFLLDPSPSSLGSFSFTDTVYSAGSPTYSGKFATGVAGDNFFLGRFTGPNAEETIGAWALPFHYSGDGQDHQAFGAWIAKH